MASRIIDINLVRDPILNVWNAIASDLTGDIEDGARQKLTNIAAVECCIDASRISTFAWDRRLAKRAEDELDRAIKEHGYPKVLRTLARHIKLI